MSFHIVRNDITKMEVDCIVNSTNIKPVVGFGVDYKIHKKAGPKLLIERKTKGIINIGEAKITRGYNLDAKYVIHTVGPIWNDGLNNEYEYLRDCYLSSLELAKKNGIESIAFPLISSGAFGYPKEKAVNIAVDTIKSFLYNNDMTVYLVVYDKLSYELSKTLVKDVEQYIKDNLIKGNLLDLTFNTTRLSYMKTNNEEVSPFPKKRSINDLLDQMDDTFVQTIFRLTDEKGMTDVELYKKANIDRKLFSKIKSDIHYQPSKMTAIAFAISLELNLDKTKDLLKKAGYALSPSKELDLIIQYFIETKNYDLYEINLVLFKFDQKTL